MDWGRSSEWLVRLKAGEPAAQAWFFDACWPEVYARCADVLGACPDAVEVASDVLCDFVFERAASLERPEGLRSYLRLMAVRRSLRARDRRTQLQPEEIEIRADDRPGPEETAWSKRLAARLAACLGELTEKAQQVVYLRFSREMSQEQIGAALGGSKQYIGRLVGKSLAALRACLEQKEKTHES